MAKFDMGEFAKTLAQPVSESGTGREQIEYIDVDLLDSDPETSMRSAIWMIWPPTSPPLACNSPSGCALARAVTW